MATGLNKPILQHSRAGKGGGSELGSEVSTAPGTGHHPFPTWKSSNPAAPMPPRFEQPGSAEDTPNGFGKPQKRPSKCIINLSQEGCPIIWKLLSFIMPGFPAWLSQVSLANTSTKLSKISAQSVLSGTLFLTFVCFFSFFYIFLLDCNLFESDSWSDPCMLIKVIYLKS